MKMKLTRSALLQLVIWLGIWVLFAFSFGGMTDDPYFYLRLTLRISVLAGFFNLASYGLLPIYFSGKTRRFLLLTGLAIAGFVFISLVFELTIFRSPRPGDAHLTPLQELAKNWKFFVLPNVFTIVAILGSASAFQAISAYEGKKKAEEEANRRRLEAEIALLKSQINPHFLLNTINNLYALSLTEPDKTPDALLRLASMVRYILYECAKPLVPLQDDLAFIESYIALQRLRLSPNVTLHTELPTAVPASLMVEPMILITFIENAFKHGLTTAQPCTVRIALTVTGSHLHLLVENPIFPDKPLQTAEPSGIGAINTRQRLAHFYPGLHQLDVRTENGLYRVDLGLTLNA